MSIKSFMLFSAKIVFILLWQEQRQELTKNIINIKNKDFKLD